jgi:hypothetical protein
MQLRSALPPWLTLGLSLGLAFAGHQNAPSQAPAEIDAALPVRGAEVSAQDAPMAASQAASQAATHVALGSAQEPQPSPPSPKPAPPPSPTPDPTPDPAPAPGQAPPAAEQAPSSFAPGPGILPPRASEEAKARWALLTAALRAPGVEGPPRAFDVRFELLNRGGAVGALEPGSLDGKLRVRYLEPHFVSVALENGKESGYGPRGYYLKDGKQRIELNTREYETDRQSIQQALSLAKNFVALAHPAQLTLFDLSIPAGPPAGRLPKTDFNWKRLEWVEIHSPDFRLLEAPERWGAVPGATDLYAVRLGLDAESKLPRAVHLRKLVANGQSVPAEQLVLLSDFRGLSGFTVPSKLLIFERLPAAAEAGLRDFLELPSRELYLLSESRLNQEIVPEAFGG